MRWTWSLEDSKIIAAMGWWETELTGYIRAVIHLYYYSLFNTKYFFQMFDISVHINTKIIFSIHCILLTARNNRQKDTRIHQWFIYSQDKKRKQWIKSETHSDQPTTFSKHPKRKKNRVRGTSNKERRRRRKKSYRRHPWRVFRDPTSPSDDRALLV